MTSFRLPLAALGVFLLASHSIAAPVSIDLSGAVTGTSIIAPGGSFAQTFAGQSVSGNAIIGSPTSPLSLSPSGTIDVQFFNPVVSPASNSLLSQPGNVAPLSILLDSNADSITFTSGFGNPPSSYKVDFFDGNGNLVNTVNQPIILDYNIYSYSGLGTFRGLTISNNNDAAGLRFQNFTYNSVAQAAEVPEPASVAIWSLMTAAGVAAWRRRRSATRV